MGSNETATATTGGPRVIDVFDGNGAPSGPNCTLFPGADRLLEASGGRSGGGSRLHRIRRRCGGLVLSESPGSKPWPFIAKDEWAAERNRPKMLEAPAHAV